MPATIEIRSRLVDAPLPNKAQHMYIVYTNEAGEKRVLRGNPERETFAGALFDDIFIEDLPYTKFKSNGSRLLDFDENNAHKSQTLFSGNDSEMLSKISLARDELSRINSEEYDYNLPIFETILKNTEWANLNKQNSNTIAVRLAEVMGLKDKVLNFVEVNNLNTPGSNAILEHSSFEKTSAFLYESIIDSGNSISNFFSEVYDNFGNIYDGAKEFFSSFLGIDSSFIKSDIAITEGYETKTAKVVKEQESTKYGKYMFCYCIKF